MSKQHGELQKTHVQSGLFCGAAQAGLSPPFKKPYPVHMSGFFFIAMVVAMLLALGSLFVGIVSMVKGGEFNQKYGNKLMQMRVYMQGAAIALFALAFLASGQS